ncbi:cruciform cutting endonuclease 1, mitochondrial [Monosporozyma servazzii]
MLNSQNILSSLLNDLKLNQLNKLSSLVGALKSGGAGPNTKLQKCIHINSYLLQLNHIINNNSNSNNNSNIHILSIDTGIINFAWSHLNLNLNNGDITLLNWSKLNLLQKFDRLDTNTFNPQNMSHLTSNLTEYILATHPNVALYTIERQRLRTNSSKFITEPILNVNIFEHLLFHSLTNANKFVMSSDPARITKFWLANQLNYSTKDSKRLRIEIVNKLVNSQTGFQLNKSLNERFFSVGLATSKRDKKLFDKLQLNEVQNGKRKDDDLADSLLHGLSWSFWLRNCQDLNNEMMKDGENLKLNEWVEYNWNKHINFLDSIGMNKV